MLVSLLDYVSIISGGTPKTSVIEYWNGDIPWLSIDDFKNCNKYVYEANKFITQKGLQNSSTNLLKHNDIIISARGTVGKLALIYKEMAFNQSCFGIRVKDENILNPEYLFYYLKCNISSLLKKSQGAIFDTINLDTFKYIKIELPNIKTQIKYTTILSYVDSQIERNKAIVQSIYNRWFIQFDFPNNDGKPYKTSGGKMVYNNVIKRDIPEEWKLIKLKDLMFKVNRHFDYSKDEKTIDLSVMPSNSFCLTEINSSKSFSTNLFSMKKGDLLFGSIRPYLKKAGFAPCDGAVAGTVHCLNVYNEFDYNFCLLTLCSENMFDYASKASKGTKMPVISCDDLLDYPIIYNEKIIRMFQSLNLKDFISHLIAENHKLTSIKNKLLSLLINGQLQ